MSVAIDITQRPGLAYQHAFDWLAVRLHSAQGPVAYAIGGDWHLAEMASRLPAVPTFGSNAVSMTPVSVALGLASIPTAELTGESWAAVGLVEPERIEQTLLDSIPPGGRLYVVAGGRLARFLAERKAQDGHRSMTAIEVVAEARAAGFRVVERLGIHPPAAILEHYAGAAAMAFGRRDARDRRHFAMRRSMVTGGRAAGLSALVCLAMERAQ